MRVTAALTGFDFDVIEGVKGEVLSSKALPGVGQSHSSVVASGIRNDTGYRTLAKAKAQTT